MQALNPTVDPEEIERFSRIAEEWWDPHGKFRPLHQLNPVRLTFLRDHLCQHYTRDAAQPLPLKDLNIVDVGCGGGLLSEPLARMGANVTGIDASEKNIRIASAHAKQSGLTIDYQHSTAEMLAEQHAQFDAVAALEIVEHVADVDTFIAACSRIVKPGGLLFLSTMNRTMKAYAMAIVGAEYVLRWLPRGTHSWSKFLRPSELAGHMRNHSLVLKEQQGMVFDPFRQKWNLSAHDLDVNYLQVAEKVIR